MMNYELIRAAARPALIALLNQPPASRASVIHKEVIPGLRSSRHIGTRSPGATLCRPDSSGLVDAPIRVDSLVGVIG